MVTLEVSEYTKAPKERGVAILENMLIISIIVVVLTFCSFECSETLFSPKKLYFKKFLKKVQKLRILNNLLIFFFFFYKIEILVCRSFSPFCLFCFMMRHMPFQRKKCEKKLIKCKELFYFSRESENFIIFSNSTTFQYRFNLPKVNENC